MTTRLLYSMIIVAVAMVAVSCSETATDPVDDDEGEIITTVQVTLRPTGGGSEIVVVWEDLDGEGGNAPNRIDTMRVGADTSYSMTIWTLPRLMKLRIWPGTP